MVRWLREGEELLDPLAPYAAAERQAQGRPYVLANMVGGLDGSAAIGGRVGALSTPVDAQLFLALRALADVVLVGAQTVRREQYGAVRLDEPAREQRVASGRGEVPPIAIVTRSLDLDWSLPLFTDVTERPGPRPIIVTADSAPRDRARRAAEHADVVVAGQERVDPRAALQALADRGLPLVLCEGGPTLLGELVASDLLDELCLSVTPVMGGDPLPLSITPAGAELKHFRLAHALVEVSTLFLRYTREPVQPSER